MKRAFVGMCLVLALGCAGSMAADGKKDKTPPADGSTVTMVGMMAVKAKDAKGDVICRLAPGNQKMDKVYNLVATGDMAKQLEALRQEGDKIKVVGKLTGDDIAVEKVEKVVYMKK